MHNFFNMYLISTEQGLEYVEKVKAGTLPREEWTHEIHLIVGLFHVVTYGEKAHLEMRKTIWNYNEAVGTKNTDESGYHDTMTLFWLWELRQFCIQINRFVFDEIAIDELLFNESLVERNRFLEFYSLDLMKSVEARRNFVFPNLKPMQGIDFFVV